MQKQIKKLVLSVNIFLLAVMLLGGFVGFGVFLPFAQAACPYSVNLNSNNDTVPYNSNIVLSSSVYGSGACDSSVTFQLNVINDFYPNGTQVSSQMVQLKNNTANANFSLPTQGFAGNSNSSTNQVKFQILVSNGIYKSPIVVVNITNIPTVAIQRVPVQISFGGTQGIYKDGDKVDVTAALTGNKYIPSNITSAYFGLYVNNSPQAIVGFDNIKITDLQNYPQTYNGLVVNAANGFIGGAAPTANTVTVKFFQSNTPNEIGEGSAVLQAQGVNGGTATVDSNKNNGSVCNDSTECKSNFCTGDSSKCEACTDDSVCNTGGDTGFVCKSGVCVKASSGTGAGSGGPTIPGSVTAAPPSNPTSNCTGANPDASKCLKNPLPADSLVTTFLIIVKSMVVFLGVWAVLFVIVGAFQLIMASGSEEMISKGKKTITWAILGLVIALMSFTIVAVVQNILVANTGDVKQFVP